MNANLKTHKDLDAWKRSMDLVETIYKATKEFPPEELYGLTSQLRRAAVSIPSNIVYPVKYMRWTISRGRRICFRGSKSVVYRNGCRVSKRRRVRRVVQAG